MNILHIISSLSARTGGPAKAVLEVSQALSEQQQKITIFSTEDRFRQFKGIDEFQRQGIEIRLFESFGRYCYAPLLRNELERRINTFDVVHIHGLWTYPTWAASQVSFKHRIPYVIRPCGMLDRYCLSHHEIRKKIYYECVEHQNLKRAAAIHFTSEAERERSLYPVDVPTAILPLGINLNDYILPPSGRFKKRYPQLKDKRIILFLGRVNFKKGLDLLIQAFNEIVQKIPSAHCVIAGPDDEGYGKKLRNLIEQKKVQGHITFVDFVDEKDKLELLGDSEIFCLPSRQENFGIAMIEAMAAGLPVVISDQVNLSHEIKLAGAGLITSLDSKELTSVLLELLNNDQLRTSMIQNGKAFVKENYQWQSVAQKWLETYETLTDSKELSPV